MLLGISLLAVKSSTSLEQSLLWIKLQHQKLVTPENQPDGAVFKLVSTPPQKREAQLEAIALKTKSNLQESSRARYLLAADLIKRKQGEKALRYLDNLEWDYPLLAPYIALKRAQAYEAKGDKAKALDAWQEILKRYPDESVAAEALYALSVNDPQYWEKAIAKFPYRHPIIEQLRHWYAFSPIDPQYWEKAIKNSPSHPRLLELAREQIKQNPKQPELMLLMARYAFETPGITDILDQLVGRYGEAEDEKGRPLIQPEDWEAIALGYWKDRKYGQASSAYSKAPRTSRNAYRVALGLRYAEQIGSAKRAYEQLLRDFPDAPEAADGLIELASLVPDIEAVPYLDKAIRRYPERAGDALYAKAHILEQLGSSQAADQARQELLKKYGNTEAAGEYRWQMAQTKARDGDIQAALQWAKPIMAANPDSEPARKSGFWVGKWATKLGRVQEAKTAYEQVIATYPQSYYAWRSAVQLGWDVGDFTTVRKLDPQVVLPTQRPNLPVGSPVLQELYQLGQDQDAWMLWQAEFRNRIRPTVAEQFTDGLLRLAVGDHREGIARISTLENRETPQEQAEYQTLQQQLTYWQALYPFPFRQVIKTYAEKRQLNVLLVTALIRQESRFEPDIRSSAGAVGLMQVMPKTGSWAAENIKLKDYALENPEDNVKLGTWFFDQTHQAYKNNSLLAVASYNAGQGNLSRWLQTRQVNDPDEFVESIPFNETRDYVKQVFGNYWNYLRLYEPQVQERLAKHSAEQPVALQR